MKNLSKIIISFLLAISCMCGVTSVDAVEKGSSVIINDSDTGNLINQVQYLGIWETDVNYPDLFHGGDDHWTSPIDNGNNFDTVAMEITFYGNAIELYGNLEPMAGIHQVYIDNQLISEIDTYQANKEMGVCLFDSSEYITLNEGKHVLRYAPSGKKNDSASAYNMQFDYAKVYAHEEGELQYAQYTESAYQMISGEETQILPQLFPMNASADILWGSSDDNIASVDENGTIYAHVPGECVISATIKSIGVDLSFALTVRAPQAAMIETIVNDDQVGSDMFQFAFDGAWVHEGGYPDRFEGGDEHWTTKAQFGDNYPSFTFRFVGTKVELYGHKVPDGAMADVYIDGEKVGEVDYYLPARQEKQLLFESEEMEEMEHVVTVTLNGEKNPAAGENYEAAVDYAKFYHSERDFYPTAIHLNKTMVVLEEGMTYQPEYKILPSYATVIPDVLWSSDDESIASVDKKSGEVTAHKAGSVMIRAKLDGMEIESLLQIQVKKCKEAFSAMVSDNNLHAYPDQYFDYLEQIYEKGTADMRSWSGSAWCADEVTSRIDIFTKGEAYKNVSLVSSDFTNETGSVLDEECIDMKFMKAPIAHTNTTRIMDVITNDDLMDLDAQSMYGVWVSIRVPEDTIPGTYTGILEIMNDSEVLATFDYSLEVLNFVQPQDNENSQLELWMYPYSSNRYYSKMTSEDYFKNLEHLYYVHLDDKYMKGLESQLEFYADMGGDAITVTVVEDPWNSQTPDPYPSMVKWKRTLDGTFVFDYTDLDKWIRLNMAHGIDGQIKSFSMSCWGNRITYYDEAKQKVISETPSTGSERWKELWGYFLEDYIKHMDEMGWFDITYMSMDERPLAEITPVLDLIDSYTNKDGKTMKTSLAVFNYETESIFDRIDDLSLAYQMGSPKVNEIAAARKAKGLMTTMYTCGAQNSAMLNQPGESAYSIYHAYKYGTQGFLRWALDSFNEDPLSSSEHRLFVAGDIYLIYPDERDAKEMQAQSSPRFEKLEEGIRDVAKLRYLSEHYPEYTEEIEALMSSLGKGSMPSEVSRMRSEIFRISREILFGKIEPEIMIVEGNQEIEMGDSLQLSVTSKPENLIDELLRNVDVINDSDEAITYFGSWNTDENHPDLFYGGDDHWCAPKSSEDAKNYGYEFDFYGDMFSIVGNKEYLGGIMEVYIDGEFSGTVDQYGPGITRFEKIYTSDLLDLRTHHVKIVGSGKHNMSSESYNMQLDYIETYTHQKPIWTSSDESIVTVNEDGVITAVHGGTAVIHVKIKDYNASIEVRVKQKIDISELQQLIEKVERLDVEDYTKESYEVLVEVLEAAKAVAKDESATQEEVDDALAKLTAALDDLQLVESTTPDTETGTDTGDNTNVGGLLTLLGLAGIVIAYETRKRMR